MGRPKKFSREGVLEKALPVFWQNGFAQTSVQDLESATGVNKSGLYTEFKSKEELFSACLQHYIETRSGEEILSSEPLGWKNIERFLELGPSAVRGQRGCFAVSSMRELAILPAEAREMTIEGRKVLRRLLKKNVEAETTSMSADEICDVVSVFFSGLAIECNLEAGPPRNRDKVRSFMRMLRAL
jgi:TetR/AcrR family transcriptional regulator, copper-responsive repressor